MVNSPSNLPKGEAIAKRSLLYDSKSPFIGGVGETVVMEIKNPRHPHYVKIFRAVLDADNRPQTDDNGDEIQEVVFESVCGLRSMAVSLDIDSVVIKADYKLSLPKHTFIIRRGDNLIFENRINGEVKNGKVEEAKVNNLGAKIWFNQKGNG